MQKKIFAATLDPKVDHALAALVAEIGGGIGPDRAAGVFRAIAELSRRVDDQLGIRTLTALDLAPPYVVKTVQITGASTEAERRAELDRTGWNVFCVRAGTIYLDLLTDSGTGAPSDEAWAEIMRADERYAHSLTYERFVEVARRVFNKTVVLPVHQGRAGENIVFSVLLSEMIKRRAAEGRTVVCLGNTYFDTTFAHISRLGARVINSPSPASLDTEQYDPFKGNADVGHLEEMIRTHGAQNVGCIVMTVVNNSVGGQPVSMENLHNVRQVAERHGILFILDAARIFENAFLIKEREPGYQDRSIESIVHEMTGMADVVIMSAKKDAIANMGGLVATSDERLYRMFRDLGILIEGHYSYGGMSGRDLAAMTQGLIEGQDVRYLQSRVLQVEELGNAFRRHGIPIQWPPGSNGIYMDARRFLPDLDPLFFPAQRLCAEMYLRFGIRPVEIGLSLAGRDDTGVKVNPPLDLVRFTIPRRVLTGDHTAYIAAAVGSLHDERDGIGGLMFLKEGDGNGHFTSTFQPVSRGQMAGLRPSVVEYFATPRNTYAASYLPLNAIQV